MTFPRNRWLDVKMMGDGLGVHLLKWTRRVKVVRPRENFGLGLFVKTWPSTDVTLYLLLWKIVVEQVSTYREWPWNRK